MPPPIRLVCPNCQRPSRRGMRFCGHCGMSLGDAAEIAAPPPKAHAGDRRVLTIVFCDLVGSTRLSQLLEPEDFRLVVLRYRTAFTSAVTRAGGTVGQYLGDGILAYFGYPRALEDDAPRALRAALRAQVSMADVRAKIAEAGLHLPVPLSIRLGVHSGLVVVADLGSGRLIEGAAVLGDAPNLAARLQTAAAPGTILASEDTIRLAGDNFDLVDAGLHLLAGIETPVRAFEVRAERPKCTAATSRQIPQFAIPCVNRRDERARLLAAWQRSVAGRTTCLLMQGEPGMGKTRLVCEFRGEIAAPGRDAIMLACSPQDRSSSYHPLLVWLRQELGLPDDVEPGLTRAALRHALRGAADEQHELQLAILLECASAEERRFLASSPRRRRRDVIDAFIAVLKTRLQPGTAHLLVVEDLQWADDGTIAVMRGVAERAASLRLMLLATARSAAKPPPDFITEVIQLERLPIEDAKTLIRAIMGDKTTPEMVDRIASRTDGIPLYAEEVARLASVEPDLARPGRRETIPLTLRTTLAAQLDRMGKAKSIAQAASALGQTFQRPVLERIVDEADRPRLDAALQRLLDAKLIEPYPQVGDPRGLAFRHALIRDAAYDSILRDQRQALHGTIARTLTEQFSNSAQGRPEIVAQHFALAGLRYEAAERYKAAASRAVLRSIHAEALDYCRRGLDLLAELPPTKQTIELEIRLQILLAAQITVVKGNADRAVRSAFERARDLAEELGDATGLRRALRGLQTWHLVRGEIDVGHGIGERIRALAGDERDPAELIQLHRPHGLTLLYLGRFEEAKRELLAALGHYDPDQHASHRFEYGSDPAVLSRAHLSWAHHFLGEADAAERESAASIHAARALQHAHSLGFALAFRCCLAEFNDDPATAHEVAAELIALAEHNDYAYWHAWGHIVQGWAFGALGDRAAGQEKLQHGLSAYQATGAGLMVPYAQLLMATLLEPDDRRQAARLRAAARRATTRGRIDIWHAWLRRRTSGGSGRALESATEED